jgi:hypothetical protein
MVVAGQMAATRASQGQLSPWTQSLAEVVCKVAAVPKVDPGEGVLNTEIGKWSLKFS